MIKRIRTFSKNKNLILTRRREIVKGATKVFLKNGYSNTSTRDLIEQLGISQGALYHYFGSKKDILFLVIEFAFEDQSRLIDRMKEQIESMSPPEVLRKCLKMYITNVDELEDMYNFIKQELPNLPYNERYIVYDSERRMINFFDSLLKTGIKSGEFKKHNSLIKAHNIIVIANAWARRRWFLRRKFTIEKYIEEETKEIMQGISK